MAREERWRPMCPLLQVIKIFVELYRNMHNILTFLELYVD